MAAGARQVLREAGRRIPDDVALVGYDDSAIARHMDPPLTSVRQPIEEMGRSDDRPAPRPRSRTVARPPPGTLERRRLVLPTELVARTSS